MKLLYQGKTKDVYALEDGTYLLKFKDDVTGENGVFDPGANTVGLSIDGIGKAGIRLTEYFFNLIKEANIPTHFIKADVDNATLNVYPAETFGNGLEVICRFKAVGSFYRRYGAYVKSGQDLDSFVEVTIKDDLRQDPPISKDALAMLNILTEEEYEILKTLTKQICNLVKDDLAKKGLTLYDIKLEFGRVNGQIALIDEISGGNMRVFQGDRAIEPLELVNLVLVNE